MKRKILKAMHLFSLHKRKAVSPEAGKQAATGSQKLEALPLPQHVVQVLHREGIDSVGDVLSRKSGDWEEICNFTQGDFDKLVNALDSRGISYDVKFDPQKYNDVRRQWERQKKGRETGREVHPFLHPITVSITLGGHKKEQEEHERLPEDIVSRLKQILTGDFYFIQEIQDVFMDEFPHEKVWKLNAHAIEQLGFFTESNYAISDRFLNAASYFSALLGQDVVDLRGRPYLHKISVFRQTMSRKKRSLDLIEMQPEVFWSSGHLGKLGISKSEMRAFRDQVDAWTEAEEFFTIASLRKSGFQLPWTGQQLGDWFYASVLVEGHPQFRYIHFGDSRLIRNSMVFFNTESFLESLVQDAPRPVRFRELVHGIKEKYGCCCTEKQLKRIIAKDKNLSSKVELF